MPASDHREAVLNAESGDSVDVATEDYDYVNPLEVATIASRDLWETPAGPDILVAVLEIDGARTTYTAEYNGGTGEFVLDSRSTHSDVTQFALVDDEGEDESAEAAANDDSEETETGESSVSWITSSNDDEDSGEEVSADGGTAAKYSTGSVDLDPSEHAPSEEYEDDSGEEWDMSFPVPDGITQQQVESAVQGSLSLQGVLERLDWPDGDRRAKERVRALVFDLGLYDDLTEPEAWDRGRARQRGWQ